MVRWIAFLILGMAFMADPLWAKDALPEDLTDLSLEALMSIEVTSVSRRTEKIADAAAAVFVITQEDIERSSATTIPDLLRMVPGLHVAKIDATKWAVTSRGFNGRFANKLLVLMDGRSLYSSLFSGVFWDAQDTVLEDIDRIEIIRGPGATLWGANAVNGVINIITKGAAETHGTLISGGLGTEERGFGTVRFGDSLSEQTSYRIYAKYFDRDGNVNADGDDSADSWHQWRSGFRMDHHTDGRDLFTLQGDIYKGQSGETATYAILSDQFPYFSTETEDHQNDLFGANLLGRWSRNISETSDMSLQTYFDHALYNVTVMDTKVDTFDLDFQHRFQVLSNQSIIWGLGYRYISDELDGTFSTTLDPDAQDYRLVSAFVQDDVTLVPHRLRFTIGTKFEHNDFSGAEWQPSARLLWTPSDYQSIWAAVSRAVRTPSRGDVANRVRMSVPEFYPFLSETLGNPDFDSEKVNSYELGYRIQTPSKISFDFALFHNEYDDLRLVSLHPPILNPPPQPSVIQTIVGNNMKGKTHGVEVAADWPLVSWWRLQAAYTFIELDLESKSSTSDYFIPVDQESAPRHQGSLRSFMDLSESWQLDVWFRYVDKISVYDIDSYLEMDLRLNWHIGSNMDLTLVGKNLLDDNHAEYEAEFIDTASTEVQRSVYTKFTVNF